MSPYIMHQDATTYRGGGIMQNDLKTLATVLSYDMAEGAVWKSRRIYTCLANAIIKSGQHHPTLKTGKPRALPWWLLSPLHDHRVENPVFFKNS